MASLLYQSGRRSRACVSGFPSCEITHHSHICNDIYNTHAYSVHVCPKRRSVTRLARMQDNWKTHATPVSEELRRPRPVIFAGGFLLDELKKKMLTRRRLHIVTTGCRQKHVLLGKSAADTSRFWSPRHAKKQGKSSRLALCGEKQAGR